MAEFGLSTLDQMEVAVTIRRPRHLPSRVPPGARRCPNCGLVMYANPEPGRHECGECRDDRGGSVP